MADTATINVRMDAGTKDAFTAFCEEIGMSASSLMTVFAKTVVRNQEVPFPLTSARVSASQRYARIFPTNEAELEKMLTDAAAAPLDECLNADAGVHEVERRLGW